MSSVTPHSVINTVFSSIESPDAKKLVRSDKKWPSPDVFTPSSKTFRAEKITCKDSDHLDLVRFFHYSGATADGILSALDIDFKDCPPCSKELIDALSQKKFSPDAVRRLLQIKSLPKAKIEEMLLNVCYSTYDWEVFFLLLKEIQNFSYDTYLKILQNLIGKAKEDLLTAIAGNLAETPHKDLKDDDLYLLVHLIFTHLRCWCSDQKQVECKTLILFRQTVSTSKHTPAMLAYAKCFIHCWAKRNFNYVTEHLYELTGNERKFYLPLKAICIDIQKKMKKNLTFDEAGQKKEHQTLAEMAEKHMKTENEANFGIFAYIRRFFI